MATTVRPFAVGLGGTTKARSSPEKALKHALALAEAQGADTDLFDGSSIHLPMYGSESSERSPDVRRLITALRRADDVIIATPCYHGSVSGLLTNALDYVEDMAQDPHPHFDGRAVALIVCGSGWQTTAITLSALRSIAHALRGWPTPMGGGHQYYEQDLRRAGRGDRGDRGAAIRNFGEPVGGLRAPALRTGRRNSMSGRMAGC